MNQTNTAFPYPAYAGKLAHTYSIVARDPATGEMGAAVQSHWFSVGRLAIWTEAGVGAIATQAFVNCMLGQQGLMLLREGRSAHEVVQDVLKADDGRDMRQLAIIDAHGQVAAWTGNGCIPEAGHLRGENFSVQANLMLNETVWPAMADAFQHAGGPLAERMLVALEAAQHAGGDLRGQQAAALVVVRGESTGKLWEDRLIDLRIDDHPTPLHELRRLLSVQRAYHYMNAGDLAIERHDVATAFREYDTAQRMLPENLEIKYWHAVSLANIGRVEESLPIFALVFERDAHWKILTKRLKKIGMLQIGHEHFEKILVC